MGFSFPCPLHFLYYLVAIFLNLKPWGHLWFMSLLNLHASSSHLHILLILPLKCLPNPPYNSVQTAANFLPCSDPNCFSSSSNLSIVYYLYTSYGSLWEMFLGPSLWQCLEQPMGYKTNQVFQSFLMWSSTSEPVVMLYFSQPKNTALNKIQQLMVQGIWCIVNLLREDMCWYSPCSVTNILLTIQNNNNKIVAKLQNYTGITCFRVTNVHELQWG